MKRLFFFPGIMVFLILVGGCSGNQDTVVYQPFKDQTWLRFEPVRFDIPVTADEKNYDVIFFARHTGRFEYDDLDFNMVMTTPSGEERIREYKATIRSGTGSFTGNCAGDSCEVTVSLKKDLTVTKGNLHIELENLIPRLETKGLLGVGIRLHPR